MASVKALYFRFFVFVYALYAFFNKGIAYSYLAEVTLVTGLLLILWNLRRYEFAWGKRMTLLAVFVSLSIVYIIRGLASGYGLVDVVRDSVMFNYIGFAFIIYFFKDDLPELIQRLSIVYKWYPFVMCFCFLLSSYNTFFRELILFGGQRLFLYKFGDMGVHLFIASILLLSGNITLRKRYFVMQCIMIVYLLLIVASYSRSGMMSYVLAMGAFLVYTKNVALRRQVFRWIKFVPLLILLALPLFLSTNVEENFQGRSLSLEQLSKNATSIFSFEDDGSTLSDNKAWRLLWWARIVDETFMGPFFLWGKGMGMSLVPVGEAGYDVSEGDLRSPHSFHMTVLARFGVPVFLLWICWMYLHLSHIRKKNTSPHALLFTAITLAFLVNASFDVFLEGPMGAFPFWTFVGLAYAEEVFKQKPENPARLGAG